MIVSLAEKRSIESDPIKIGILFVSFAKLRDILRYFAQRNAKLLPSVIKIFKDPSIEDPMSFLSIPVHPKTAARSGPMSLVFTVAVSVTMRIHALRGSKGCPGLIELLHHYQLQQDPLHPREQRLLLPKWTLWLPKRRTTQPTSFWVRSLLILVQHQFYLILEHLILSFIKEEYAALNQLEIHKFQPQVKTAIKSFLHL